MRLWIFRILSIAIGTAIQFALTHLPHGVDQALGKWAVALMFLLPAGVTAWLAHAAMRGWSWHVLFLAVLSPFVSWIFLVVIGVLVLR